MDQIRQANHQPVQRPAKSTFSELFTPKLVTVLREGYTSEHLKADAIAGLTVAIVALPLSMAIAIASGVTPERGLFTAIVGGFIVSALGGGRFQIGGPAGALIVLVAATVQREGIDGLLLATMMSGVFLLAIGYLRLGTYIKPRLVDQIEDRIGSPPDIVSLNWMRLWGWIRPSRISAAPRRRGRADCGRCRAAPIFLSDTPRPTRRIRNPTRRPSPMAPLPDPRALPRHGACAVKTAT